MITKLQKWGNSLGLRIPRAIAKELEVADGSEVDVSVQEGRIVLRPVKTKKYKLKELLSKVNDRNIHAEFESGPPRGREAL